MTKNTLPNTADAMRDTIATTANDLGHRAEFAARTGRPLPVIRLADGRELSVRGARFSPMFTTLLYTAGPSDTYRHDAPVDVLPDEQGIRPVDDPCANCTRDLADHDRDELSACQAAHLDAIGVTGRRILRAMIRAEHGA